jgi:TRAP-type C4-dicarboxylate transport system permease large subunit
MGLLIAAGRSWINMLLIPAGITVVILAVASLSSVRDAFWASLILHLFLLVFFLGSYISFVLRERKKKR